MSDTHPDAFLERDENEINFHQINNQSKNIYIGNKHSLQP